jgi:3-oxoacyl-[acyl-carrier protein] reductase
VVLVSGGSRGLGAALVSDLLERGHAVATFSRAGSPFTEERCRADASATTFTWEAIDATDVAHVKKFVLAVARRFGRIDVLINNAAIGTDGLLAMMRPEDIHKCITINLEAVIHLTQACSRVMLAQRSGTILNISSTNAVRGNVGVSVYSAAKAGLDGLTRSLARELGPEGIRVNSIAAGYFESEMADAALDKLRPRIIRRTPLGRLGTISDLLGAVRFLISPESSFITGHTLAVDGGIGC